jgi:hypothetical protein
VTAKVGSDYEFNPDRTACQSAWRILHWPPPLPAFWRGGSRAQRRTRSLTPALAEGFFLGRQQNACALGGDGKSQIYPTIWGRTRPRDSCSSLRTTAKRIRGKPRKPTLADFFDVDPTWFQLGAEVGNPRFIRYQSFSGSSREKALRRALAQNVKQFMTAFPYLALLARLNFDPTGEEGLLTCGPCLSSVIT